MEKATFFRSRSFGMKMGVGSVGRARTSKTVISTGMMVPAWSWVLALYSLQNIMMFTPWVRKEGAGKGATVSVGNSIVLEG